MTTEVKTQRTSNGIAWLVGMVVLVVIGAIAWGVQLSKGMSVLGINQIITWGIYIAAFFALVGLASGLLILAVLSDMGVLQGLGACPAQPADRCNRKLRRRWDHDPDGYRQTDCAC